MGLTKPNLGGRHRILSWVAGCVTGRRPLEARRTAGRRGATHVDVEFRRRAFIEITFITNTGETSPFSKSCLLCMPLLGPAEQVSWNATFEYQTLNLTVDLVSCHSPQNLLISKHSCGR